MFVIPSVAITLSASVFNVLLITTDLAEIVAEFVTIPVVILTSPFAPEILLVSSPPVNITLPELATAPFILSAFAVNLLPVKTSIA